MHLIARTLITIISVLLFGGSAFETPADPHPLTGATGTTDSYYARTSTVVARVATTEQQLLVAEAVELFEDAGLELPPTDIYFHADAAPCNGAAGLHYSAAMLDALVHRIDMCHRLPMFVVHELAHAWAALAMDDDDRDRAMQRWGLTAWNDHDHEWSDRGTERVAQTVTYTLITEGKALNDHVADYICSYEAITGTTHDAVRNQNCAA